MPSPNSRCNRESCWSDWGEDVWRKTITTHTIGCIGSIGEFLQTQECSLLWGRDRLWNVVDAGVKRCIAHSCFPVQTLTPETRVKTEEIYKISCISSVITLVIIGCAVRGDVTPMRASRHIQSIASRRPSKNNRRSSSQLCSKLSKQLRDESKILKTHNVEIANHNV